MLNAQQVLSLYFSFNSFSAGISSIQGSLPSKNNEMAYKVQMEMMEKALEKLL